MIIFLYGPDDYRRQEKKKAIIADFSKKHSALGSSSFDFAEDEAFENFKEYVRSQSMFEASKLAVAENIFEIEEKRLDKELKNFLEHPSVTILISERSTPLKAFQFLIKKPVLSQEFEYLKGADLKKFIEIEAQKRGITLHEPATRILSSAYAENTWGLVTELDKISLLGQPAVGSKELAEFEIESAPGFWELFGGFKMQDLRARLSALATTDHMHEPAAKVFNILSAQMPDHALLFARGDFLVKSGKLEYEEALLELLLRA